MSWQIIDYFETFTPVVRHELVSTLLLIAAKKHQEMVKFDVRTFFLYGEFEEKIYRRPSKGCIEKSVIVKILDKNYTDGSSHCIAGTKTNSIS